MQELKVQSDHVRLCDPCRTCERSIGECTCSNDVAWCSCPGKGLPLPSCVFYSPRIKALFEGQRTDYETAQDHFTTLDPTSVAEEESIGEENRKYFDEVLVKHPQWGAFFTRFEDLEVGGKIGEGGQAEIFKASSKSYTDAGNQHDLVAKVWKAGVSLKDLEQQWPPKMLSNVAQDTRAWPFRNLRGGAFIRDGEFKNRFAFVMWRRWGDVRTLIDQLMLEMLQNNNHGPPRRQLLNLYELILEASEDLCQMHEAGVLHRDIKASNMLLSTPSMRHPFVIDFECSVGITGTGFWRAPEILKQLQEKVPSHKVVFTEKADIYSFGMFCYEVITGCIPFEGHPSTDYSVVIRGKRPELPRDVNFELKQLILQCWQGDPQLRPTSAEVRTRCSELIRICKNSIEVMRNPRKRMDRWAGRFY